LPFGLNVEGQDFLIDQRFYSNMPVETETEAVLMQLETKNVNESYDKLSDRRFGVTCPDVNHMPFFEALPEVAELDDGPTEYEFVIAEPERLGVIRSK